MSFGSPGRLVLGLAGGLLFVDLFFGWQEVCVRVGAVGRVCATRAGWHGFGIAVGLATVALIVWVTVELTGTRLPRAGAAALAAVVALLVAVEFVEHGEKRSWPAWVGLALGAVVAAAGAVSLRDARGRPR
jgi:hypothetical protein